MTPAAKTTLWAGWGLAGAAYLISAPMIASGVFVAWGGLYGVFTPWYLAWPVYLIEARADPVIERWLFMTGMVGFTLPLLVAAAVIYRRRHVRGWSLRRNPEPTQFPPRPIRSTTDNYGHSRWATLAEMRQLWPGPDPGYGGVVVGEAYDPRIDTGAFNPHDRASWGHGGTAPLLIDPCREGSTHSLIIAGSGSFKTVSAIATGLTWTGSMIVLDPAAELGPMLGPARERIDHRVFVLEPELAAVCGFNAVGWIDITAPTAETDVAAVVEWIAGGTQRRDATAQFFKDKGKALITCLLAHLLWDPDLAPDLKSLRTLRAALTVPETELRLVLKRIHKVSHSRLARDLAGPLCEMFSETFSGIYANADEDTKWLSTGIYADLVAGNAFEGRDILNGRTDVFVSLPLKALQATPAVARCIIGALLNAVYEADGELNGRVLVLLDEAARLGRLNELEVARDAGRKYGITLQLLFQSTGQIEQIWGRDGLRSWYEAVSWRSYAAIKDAATARDIADTIGTHGVLSWSQNTGLHGRSLDMRSRSTGVTYSEHSRSLIRPEEICNDLRQDAQIIIPKNGRPVLCGRALYFRREQMAAQVGVNRFARRTVNA